MATELTELAALAAENITRERADGAIQTSLDDWADRLELEARLAAAVAEVDVHEPLRWVDVVSYGPAAVVGFLMKKGDDREIVFS